MIEVRKVGETFKYGEVTLRVERDTYHYCKGCYFKYLSKFCEDRDRTITGSCCVGAPKNWVKFVEVKEGGEE